MTTSGAAAGLAEALPDAAVFVELDVELGDEVSESGWLSSATAFVAGAAGPIAGCVAGGALCEEGELEGVVGAGFGSAVAGLAGCKAATGAGVTGVWLE